MTKKRILLTGAAGRVGRLVRPLLPANYALRLCDAMPLVVTADDDEIVQGDLADPALAARAVEGVAAVVHLAGLVAPDVSFEDTRAPNYRAVLNLLEACRHGGVRRFVFASSHHIVGLHVPGALAADAPVAPDGFYGLSKVFGEAACALYARRLGYRPQDHATEHHAADFRPLSAMSAADGAGFVGGGFAASALPDPFGRT